MFGISWGIVSIILMTAAGNGLYLGQRKQAQTFGKDIMIVFGGRTSMQAGGIRAGRSLRWNDTDHARVQEQSPSCRYVLPELGVGGLPVRSLYNAASLLVTASLPPFAEVRSIPVGEGRFYGWVDQTRAQRVAFLGTDVKKQLFGSRSALGETIQIENVPYTVIGVMEDKKQNSDYDGRDTKKIFIPFSSMIRDFPDKPPSLPHTIDRLLVTPLSVADHESCKWQVRRALALIHHFDPNDKDAASIWDTIEDAQAFQQMTDSMQYFLGAVGIVSLLLGGIGVMNVMLIAVRERTREIGMRKAVGATSRSILGQFFAETLILAFFSGGIGLGAALGVCAVVNQLPMPLFFAGLIATWGSALVSLGALAAVALGSAVYPAWRAASLDPIEALRYEAGS